MADANKGGHDRALTLNDQDRFELLQVLAHETLHLYIDSQYGGLSEYLAQPDSVHDWIYSTSTDIALNKMPSILSYPTPVPGGKTHF